MQKTKVFPAVATKKVSYFPSKYIKYEYRMNSRGKGEVGGVL